MTSNHRGMASSPDIEPAMQKILAALRGLRFGSVEITVHEGCIVQIERREKQRFNIPCPGTGETPETPDGE